MVLSVTETHDQFRVEIDAGELQRALDFFTTDPGIVAVSSLGTNRDEQAELFMEFAADYLSHVRVRTDRTDWPDRMWRAVVQRTSERSLGIEEITVGLGAKRVYFWGCEIGHLVQLGSLRFRFDDDDDPEGRGC